MPQTQDSVSHPTAVKPKKKGGRGGAYDSIGPWKNPFQEVKSSGARTNTLLAALSIPSDVATSCGFKIPKMPLDVDDQALHIGYDWIGDAFVRDPTQEGEASMSLPKLATALMTELHPGWKSQSESQLTMAQKLYKLYGEDTRREGTAWYDERQLVNPDTGEVATQGTLFVKEGAKAHIIETRIFGGSPTDASRQWWQARAAEED
jgi:hypothetical protein